MQFAATSATAYFDPDTDFDDCSPFSAYNFSSATASDSPASEPYPPSASSSRHPSSSSLPPPNFSLSADNIPASYNNNPYPEVFDSDREDDAKQLHNLAHPQQPFMDTMNGLPQGVQLNTETWYGESADFRARTLRRRCPQATFVLIHFPIHFGLASCRTSPYFLTAPQTPRVQTTTQQHRPSSPRRTWLRRQRCLPPPTISPRQLQDPPTASASRTTMSDLVPLPALP